MKTIAIDLSDKLVHSIGRTAANPASSRQGDEVIIVPNYHAIPHKRVDIHGVKQCDLGYVKWQLRIVVFF